VIRVLHLTTDLELGGRERVIVDLSNKLVEMGFIPSICCLHHSGAWAHRLRSEVEVIELHKKKGLDFSVVKPLRDYLVQGKFDIMHTHNPGTLLYGLLAARWARTRTIINTEHGFAYNLSLKARVKDKILYRNVDCITAVSENLRENLINLFGLQENKVHTLRNGIFAPRIREARSVSKRKIGMPDDRFNIGIVARLVPVKNHSLLLEAFSIVREKDRRVLLWIVGSGELRNAIMRRVHELGIQDDVVLMGSRTDIPVILNALDLFVLSSLSEGLSVTLLEAMSVGVPIVATNVGGNGEVIENGKSGLLVESNYPEALAGAILTVIANKALARKMRLLARKRFLENFSINTLAKNITVLYSSLWQRKIS